jgi:hypothetical protein
MQPIYILGYQEDTTYDSPSIYGGGRGGQKYLDIQDQTMEKEEIDHAEVSRRRPAEEEIRSVPGG